LAKFKVAFGDGQVFTIHLRGDSTKTVAALVESLPIKSTASRWGDEVYFKVPFHAPLETDARQDMEPGEVAFWPDGDALALFFGPTPISKGALPRAYSPCNIVGRIEGELAGLKHVEDGCKLELRLA